MKVRYVTVADLIAELQKHDPKLPIVLKADLKGDIPLFCRQLRYMEGEPIFGYLSDLFVYKSEFGNPMGQQGLGLFLDCNS